MPVQAMVSTACLQGKKSKDFAADLGYLGSVEIVHRDNIALLSLSQRSKDSLPGQPQESPTQVCPSFLAPIARAQLLLVLEMHGWPGCAFFCCLEQKVGLHLNRGRAR